MDLPNAAFNPEEVALLKQALQQASDAIPENFKASEIKTRMAVRILSAAARGERDPDKLAAVALADFADYIHLPRPDLHPAA